MNLESFDIEDFKEYLAMKKIIALSDIDYKPIPKWNPLAATQPVQTKAKCTKFCSKVLSGSKCSKGKSCTFAHCIEDWSPITCNFNNMCNRKTTNCGYIHPCETKEEFAKRINQKLPLVSDEEDDDDEEIEVVINKPYICVPKECEEMVKETMKQRGITQYTIQTF